jgi:hypothetical protein
LRPLGGAEGRFDTRTYTWILIWLKPFKGGYSRSWRVVNIRLYFISCMLDIDYYIIENWIVSGYWIKIYYTRFE